MSVDSPTVSVLMPVYNCERYLDEAIWSIREQTFTDFEFVIVNDGSTDGSLDIIRHHAAEDERIILLDRPNGGYIDALNAGLAICCGEYIARMDGDDVSLPDRLERQLRFLAENDDVCLVGSSVDLMTSDGDVYHRFDLPAGHEQIIGACVDSGCSAIFHPTWLARRRVYEISGGYDPAYYGAEDVALLLRYADQMQYANLSDVLVRYRRHPGAVGNRLRAKQVVAGEKAIREYARTKRHVSSHILSSHAYRASWTSTDEGDWRSGVKYAIRSWLDEPLSVSGVRASGRLAWKAASNLFHGVKVICP